MEIYQRGQAFIEKDGDLEFAFTKLIIKGPNHQYFYATTKDRIGTFSSVDINQLEMVPIPLENIWPLFSDHFSQAMELSSSKYYIKEPNLLSYGDSPAALQSSNEILNEVLVCEILKVNPHPNIASYIGCVVTNGRIRGICLTRYKMTLDERLQDTKAFDTDACLREIELGIRHLHSLGLIHNDINPANIMVDDSDRPVIIDFDSCSHHGEKLGPKAGTWGWFIQGMEFARYENDFFGLAKLREYMLK
ncbi:uncharacterized protein G6M90_00g079550 [Metarhizium brunneum]|uniref:Protein kinase domain-containing protein n=1 Tax=Metarhizium brunneum TaxID=500148 RepID=A0A7D5UYY0_9HYPO